MGKVYLSPDPRGLLPQTKKDSFEETFGQLYIGKHPTRYRCSLLVLLFDFSSISTGVTLERTEKAFEKMIQVTLRDFSTTNAEFLGDPDIDALVGDDSYESLEQVLVRLRAS